MCDVLPSGRHRLAGVAIAMAVVVLHASDGEPGDARVAAALNTFLVRHRTAHQYSASRRLEASGSGQRGWLAVQTDFTLGLGMRYVVTDEGGSRYIRTRILRGLLDEEQRILSRTDGAGATISAGNYQFMPEGIDEEGLAVVSLKPRRRDRSLIAGRMFLTPDEGVLIRVEGRLAKNPSFWVSRTNIVRSYRRIHGVLMPVALETTAQLRLLGSSALRMTYSYSVVDGRAVDDQ